MCFPGFRPRARAHWNPINVFKRMASYRHRHRVFVSVGFSFSLTSKVGVSGLRFDEQDLRSEMWELLVSFCQGPKP